MFSTLARRLTPRLTNVALYRTTFVARHVSFLNVPSQRTNMSARHFSEEVGLTTEDIESRLLEVIKNVEKVQPVADSVTTQSAFSDLGLDSLDVVEVVLAIEEEFQVEFPETESENLKSLSEVIEFLKTNPNAR